MATRRRGLVRRILRVLLLVVAAWVALIAGSVFAMRWIDPPFTAFMVESRIGALFSSEPGYQFRHEWRDWDRISKNAALAVVASEDQLFPDHNGFDFRQIDKALEARERGRRVRGASTISQQVAKNLFLWPGQSWVRKGLEAGITVLIETLWDKQRILEVYLNIAEFGRGTYGVQAASRRFFHKDADRLSTSESALLAAVLPAPRHFKVDAPSGYVRNRQAWIERQMASLGGTSYLAQMR
jgi:monofunctional biosynthetic peptidoglycan transglycosylase